VIGPARRGRHKRTAVGIALLATVAGVALSCTTIATNPDIIFSISLDSLPSPSVVAGDTMRDTNGVVAPLTARGYNIQGNLLPSAHIQYLSLSPSQLSINISNIATGTPAGDSLARVVASTPGFQSLPFGIPVVLAPDSIVHADTDSISTLVLSLTGGPDSNLSVPLVAFLKHIPDTVFADSVSRSYIEHFQITYPPAAAAGTGTISDTALFAYLTTGPLGIPARTDTSDANGNTARYVQFNVFKISPDTTDSIVVVATAQYPYKGPPVGGSPITWVICYSTGTASCPTPSGTRVRRARGPTLSVRTGGAARRRSTVSARTRSTAR
jgi:hypothetical protein